MSEAPVLELGKYSLGVGDRFAHQAKAQLAACAKAAALGVTVIPVWNKSNREHNVVGSEPESVRKAADEAVRQLGWKQPYHVDADHINLASVDRYLESSDFFTIDVASAIGQRSDCVDAFVARHPELTGKPRIDGIDEPPSITREQVAAIADKYLHAAEEAGRIYRHIAQQRQGRQFVTEVSMDETDAPQTPVELLVILAALADEKLPLQTIAPKFTGRFNKGVDYVGNIARFEKEFDDDVAVIAHAIGEYNLPSKLKLSVHSGSDKFSIYGPIRRVLQKTGAGVHVKTAGTTWLEELIGLAEAGGPALRLAQEIYAEAYDHREALCEPYAAVIDIDVRRLPSPDEVRLWTSGQYVDALRHDQTNPSYNRALRQLLHVGYKIAAKMGDRYFRMLEECAEPISRNVTYNLFERHICPLFLAGR
ncbi:MAG TPA: tagaturonate epimerase family protein [Bryobacteraceae bacterium]|nr:tagaturonate epimerase family protein [Bryobacteraceae bacterium]